MIAKNMNVLRLDIIDNSLKVIRCVEGFRHLLYCDNVFGICSFSFFQCELIILHNIILNSVGTYLNVISSPASCRSSLAL